MFARFGLVLLALMSVQAAVWADGPLANGNWRLVINSLPTSEMTLAIFKVEAKEGKTSGTILAVPPRSTITVKKFEVDGKELRIELSTGLTFKGTIQSDGKSVVGGYGNEDRVSRARFFPTDKETIAQNELSTAVKAPEAYTKAQQLNNRPLTLRFQAQQTKDEAKKKELQDQLPGSQKEADEKVPGLYREVVEKHADTPAALEAAMALLRASAKMKVTPEEAAKLVKVIETVARPYGEDYGRFVKIQAGTILVSQKGMEHLGLGLVEPIAKSLSESLPASTQHQILSLYKKALTTNNNAAAAKEIESRLATLDAKMDSEYLAKVPSFKPTVYAGRKEANANRVAVMELFTGAQCPPCVAADVAFDALCKAYKPSELVLVQYHMHIPGPDPLTNKDCIARWDYYRKLFASEMRGVPSSVFNGGPKAGGGGGMDAGEKKFNDYREVIDAALEKSTSIKVAGGATRNGDKIDIAVEVTGAEAKDELKVRLLLVEESIKYVGSNKIRFHHHVVRGLPGGVEGAVVKSGAFKHTASTDLGQLRDQLSKYLEEYHANERPFPNDHRPLDFKDLKVIALVQNDKTGEIAQACQIEVEGKGTAQTRK